MAYQQNHKIEFINKAKEAALFIGLLSLFTFISNILLQPFIVPVV